MPTAVAAAPPEIAERRRCRTAKTKRLVEENSPTLLSHHLQAALGIATSLACY